MMMDREQEEQVNLAAEKFAEAIRESYQALADRSVSAQELNAQLTQDFFNGVINNLRSQAGSNRALAENLIEQQHKQQEASQALTRETLKAYMDVLNSMFSFAQGSTQAAQGDHESRRPRDFEGRFVRGEEEWHESEHPRDTGGGSPDNGVLLQPQRDLSSSAQKQEDG
jgi:predicted unusual protein kinase regulating ubiquinone biosynthesis (AarF/ABC1/UbiB family)